MSEEDKEIDVGGRPSDFKEEFTEQAYKLCLLGATDKDLADFFLVCEATINNWKKSKEGFLESIRAGKRVADMEVAESLFNGARDRIVPKQQAFKVKEVSYNEKGQRVERETVQVVTLEEFLPGDFRNQQYWTKNRSPENWKDKQEVDHKSTDGTMSPRTTTIKFSKGSVGDGSSGGRTNDK
ncbi:hypothetical protein ORI89_07565 [Sphingobacterium sp. UT-1RO-CII-1]|uniref:hypothetical protein n=1 Tax=Sphingobacterium sp. UT-1RO-CII-1 TaxID=2995225 RepID=UPI00227CC672|nr:hypothetical protein [Sphingobacterium sp. UT-1RO-CII-1]MCY4779503.1 hypothetical protein [Sphingobacterium sp. UT-1RO-CII-1]